MTAIDELSHLMISGVRSGHVGETVFGLCEVERAACWLSSPLFQRVIKGEQNAKGK